MHLEASTSLITGFVLVVVRASAWLVVAPPFNTRMIPAPAKIGLAVALALPVAPRIAANAPAPETAPLVTAAALQVAIGLTLGFVALLLFSAVQAAGSLIDLFGGFTLATAYDPLSNAQTSMFGRIYSLLAVTLLFATNGHLLLFRAFLSSFDAVPLGTMPALHELSRLLTTDLTLFFLSALQIAAPLLAALFLAEVALGLLTRAAPMMNVFALGFSLKILLTLLLAGMTFSLLPGTVHSLVEHILRGGVVVTRAFGGAGG